MGPPGPCLSQSGSRYSMSRTCGPQDIISLVIPKLGITWPLSKTCGQIDMDGGKTLGHGVHDIQGIVMSHLWVPL
jgi:hypothetical protein